MEAVRSTESIAAATGWGLKTEMTAEGSAKSCEELLFYREENAQVDRS